MPVIGSSMTTGDMQCLIDSSRGDGNEQLAKKRKHRITNARLPKRTALGKTGTSIRKSSVYKTAGHIMAEEQRQFFRIFVICQLALSSLA
jgi:hypothetical protein